MKDRHLAKFRVLAAILFTVGMALIARHHSRAAALAEWLKANPPTEAIWSHALATRGLQRCRDPREIHRALRTLPGSLDPSQETWCASQCRWVAIGDSNAETALYAQNCRELPAAWERRGLGWAAYPGILRDIPARARAVAAEARDPREIRY